jgi:integrase
LYAELSPTDQWLLHDFFQPDRVLTDLELLQHRDEITQQRPSLPHQAGRALERFWATAAQVGLKRVARAKVPAGPAKRVRQADRQIVVKGLVRPEVDVEKLARAFLRLAGDRARKRRDERHATDASCAWERKDIRPWTAEEARRFLTAIRAEPLYPAFLLLILYGLRRGEVLGLRWSDIDLPLQQIHVRQQIHTLAILFGRRVSFRGRR